MIVRTVTANYLELEVEFEDRAFYTVLNAVGAKADKVCKLSVIILREGLTDEICYKNFKARGDTSVAEAASQEDLFDRT